jgi:putative chitinase
MDLNAEQLSYACGSNAPRAQTCLPYLVEAMELYEINTAERQAAFLAQIGHESGGLRWTTEIWGPTPAQVHYEGRKDLGNDEPGDGSRYRGRGFIQTTGRANYARVRDRLREKLPDLEVPDFEDEPDELAQYRWAALSAADYWDMRGLNDLADAGDFEGITRKINGGLNGQADRVAKWERAKEVLQA